MKKFIAVLAIFIAIISVFAYLNSNKMKTPEQTASAIKSVRKFERLSSKEFLARTKQPDSVIVDVRTPEEFAAGHIDGAVNIDVSNPQFNNIISKLDKKKKYSLYCRSGARSGRALEAMQSMGFIDVADLEFGYASLEQ